jgi:hypothetical protein
MKKLRKFLPWATLYILLILTVAAFTWEYSLPVSLVDRKVLLIGTLIFSGFLLNFWINQKERNYEVPPKEEMDLIDPLSNSEFLEWVENPQEKMK